MLVEDIAKWFAIGVGLLSLGLSVGYFKRRVEGNEKGVEMTDRRINDHLATHAELLKRSEHEALCTERTKRIEDNIGALKDVVKSMDEKLDRLLERSRYNGSNK